MTNDDLSSRGIDRDKLFKGICIALLPTAFSFVLVSNILYQLKTEFILTNGQVGYIGGAALWGMAISLLTIGPFLEKIGLKRATIGAFVGHLSGVTLFLVAYLFAGEPFAFWILFGGAIGFGAGNGLIEVAGNPLTATLYPEEKVTKLNHFHAFFPLGNIVGGLLGWIMAQTGTLGFIEIGHWTWQIAIIYIPIFAYGAMILPEKFPKTETEEAGIPTREMFRYVFTHPLVWALIIFKMVTLSMEMGPLRWIPEVLQAAGVHGMLIFVWISLVMLVLRVSARTFVNRFAPTGMLLGGSFLVGIGLLMFAFIEEGVVPLMIAATFFAGGVAFFFPNMTGLMSERFPKAGSLGIILLIGFGFGAAGFSNAIMGEVADRYLPDALDEQQTVEVLERVEQRFPEYVRKAEAASGDLDRLAELGYRSVDVQNALDRTEQALSFYRSNGYLDGNITGNALRAIMESDVDQEQELLDETFGILRPADNYGGRMSFLWVAPLAFFVSLVFLIIYIRDKRKGGYQAVRLDKGEGFQDGS
ncbi:MAG: MFS transporter [Balneolales bacterium]